MAAVAAAAAEAVAVAAATAEAAAAAPVPAAPVPAVPAAPVPAAAAATMPSAAAATMPSAAAATAAATMPSPDAVSEWARSAGEGAAAHLRSVAARVSAAYPGVTVEVRPGRGRCVVATRRLAAGSVVMASEAAAAVITDASRCARCVFAPAAHTCTGCRLVRYCGAECQRADWRAVHKHECKALPAARACADGGSRGGGDSAFHDGMLLARLLRSCAAGGAPPSAPGGASSPLCTTADDVRFMEAPPAGCDAWAAAGAVASVAAAAGAPTVEGLDARRVAAAFGRNNFSVADDLMTGLGAGVFPAAALLNHSCTPNAALAYAFDDASGRLVQTIRTLEDVAAGTELCHAFCEIGWPSAGRRAHLAAHYGFDCSCALCVGPPARDALLLGTAGGRDLVAPASQPELARLLAATVPPVPPLPALLAAPAATAVAVTALWQHAAIAAEHARTHVGVLARIYAAVGAPPPPPAPRVLPPAQGSGGDGGAGDGEVALEVQHAEAALAGLLDRLSPRHLDVLAAVNVLFARAMLRDDTAAAVVACTALVAWYRAAYAATPAHPMLSLQLFTLADLAGELAAYRGGVPRTCRHDVEADPARVARLAALYATPGDALAHALFTPCATCCCTLHHWQRTALAARPALYAEAGAALSIAYGPESALSAMCRDRATEARDALRDFVAYGGTLCAQSN